MSHEILLADDSKTIQKVISITLGSTPYNLHIASNEDEVKEQLQCKSFGLVLLDFGLSDDKSGYQLAAELSDVAKGSSIVMLYGTFDTVDEAKLNSVGVVDKIVKPFDSQHFLKLCENALGDSPSIQESSEDVIDLETEELDDDGDWVVEAPVAPESSDSFPPDLGPESLTEQVKDWGIEVPPVIGTGEVEDDFSMTESIPPIIKEEDTIEITQSFVMTPEVQEELGASQEIEIPVVIQEETMDVVDAPEFHLDAITSGDEAGMLPQDEDLEYPDITTAPATPKLTSMDELNHSDNPESMLDDFTDPAVNISDFDFNKAKSIEDQISDEQDPEDFWALDDEAKVIEEVSSHEKIRLSNDAPEEIRTVAASASSAGEIDYDLIVEKLRPMIEEKVREYCEQTIEKVAWEVIPDLAENLIKKQLELLKDSVVE